MMPGDSRYAHWQQQPDEDVLDYEPEPGFYARQEEPPDPQTVLERVEAFLSVEHRRRDTEEDAWLER
jgi:hypothetical protein